MNRQEKRHWGFTLIELLIVVAIIAILAAIAVPNFIEAQVRSKVSRCKSDQRTLTTALEAYMTDKGSYPPMAYTDMTNDGSGSVPQYQGVTGQTALTTPVAYITSVPRDGFALQQGSIFEYTSSSTKALPHSNGRGNPGSPLPPGQDWQPWPKDMYLLVSDGPDRTNDLTTQRFPNRFGAGVGTYRWVIPYDSSNGTVSYGDIYRWVCPARYNIVFEVGYDPENKVDPTAGAYPTWRTP